MARRSGAIIDDILGFSYEKRVFPPHVHSLKRSQCIQAAKKKDTWYIYDVRKSLPVMLNPVFRVRHKGPNYQLIDILTKEVVFSATSIAAVAKFADENLPPR
jgi:hypothetical protein